VERRRDESAIVDLVARATRRGEPKFVSASLRTAVIKVVDARQSMK